MTELDAPDDPPEVAIARLEAALERIERRAVPVPPAESAAVAARLDSLIAQLRNALAEATA